MDRAHDRGGREALEPINTREHVLEDWEFRIDALRLVLSQKGLLSSDELRRAIESIDGDQYEVMGYYERWVQAIQVILDEKSVVSQEDVNKKICELKL